VVPVPEPDEPDESDESPPPHATVIKTGAIEIQAEHRGTRTVRSVISGARYHGPGRRRRVARPAGGG
jgi:hypothetical protein